MADFKIGKVTHYYDKIGVAVVELSADLAAGDTIKISGHGREFTQEVGSMQVEHENVQAAKKGQAIGLKTDENAKPGDEVYKVD